MLMDAPPPREDAGRYQLIAEHVTECGLRTPSILASDLDSGFLSTGGFWRPNIQALTGSG